MAIVVNKEIVLLFFERGGIYGTAANELEKPETLTILRHDEAN